MATRVYLAAPGIKPESVVEGVGAAVQSSLVVAVTIDCATNTVNEGGSTRVIKKAEVLEALDKVQQWIIKGNWPPV